MGNVISHLLPLLFPTIFANLRPDLPYVSLMMDPRTSQQNNDAILNDLLQLIPTSYLKNLDGWILLLKETRNSFRTDDPQFLSQSLKLAAMLALRFVTRCDLLDWEEAKEIRERHLAAKDLTQDKWWSHYSKLMDLASQFHNENHGAVGERRKTGKRVVRDIDPIYPPVSLSPNHPGAVMPPIWNGVAIQDVEPQTRELRESLRMTTTTDELDLVVQFLTKNLRRTDAEFDLGEYATWCFEMGFSYYARFQHSGDPNDLEEAFDYNATASFLYTNLASTDPEHRENLRMATAIVWDYMVFGTWVGSANRPWDVLELVELFDLVIQNNDHQDEPVREHVLAAMHFLRYSRTHNPDHAHMAIESCESAFDHIVPSNPEAISLQRLNLASLFTSRHVQSLDSDDVTAAIQNLQEVSNGTASDAARALFELAYLYKWRYTELGYSSDDKLLAEKHFREGIDRATLATSVTEHIEFARLYIDSFKKHGDQKDLVAALGLLRNVVSTIDDKSPSFPVVALLLARTYRSRPMTGIDDENFKECVHWYQKFADTAEGDDVAPTTSQKATLEHSKLTAKDISNEPILRLMAAQRWGELSLEKDIPDCLEAFRLVVSLIDEAIWMGNKMEDKYHSLSRAHYLGAPAVAAALKFGRASSLAVEYHEHGLSIAYRQLLQLRTNVGDLKTKYPDLATKLNALSSGLAHLSQTTGAKAAGSRGVFLGTENARLNMAYKKLLSEIRSKSGFEHLFLPLPYEKLAIASVCGPVIMVGCDSITKSVYALIILRTNDEPVQMWLPNASYDDIHTLSVKLLQLLSRLNVLRRGPVATETRGGRPAGWKKDVTSMEFEAILSWIWTRVVEPVFGELAKNDIKSGRVWWCPSGNFIQLPLHAAAPPDSPYVSSYTHTVEALVNTRQRVSETDKMGPLQISAVGIGKYPGRPALSLGSVKTEMDALSQIANGCEAIQLRRIEDNEACVETVLAALKSSHVVHLACHGFQNHDQALDSHLILSNGNLELRRILKEELRLAEFAFLSACQTATGQERLFNESVHLAGGFMAAGFKGVIGTLWSIADEDAPKAAKEVYDAIVTKEGLDITKAAEGLQRAVRKMRERGVPPHRWVPFIHVGV